MDRSRRFMVQNLVWQTSTVADISLLSNRFTDVARSVTVVRAKKADLQITNGGWPYFMRVIRAVPLFGEGFGELLKPQPLPNNRAAPRRLPYLLARISWPRTGATWTAS